MTSSSRGSGGAAAARVVVVVVVPVLGVRPFVFAHASATVRLPAAASADAFCFFATRASSRGGVERCQLELKGAEGGY